MSNNRKPLKRAKSVIYHYVNGERVEGLHADLWGDVTGLEGNATGLRGNATDLEGDVTGLRGDVADWVDEDTND